MHFPSCPPPARCLSRPLALGAAFLFMSSWLWAQDPGSMAIKVSKPSPCSNSQVLKFNAPLGKFECQDDEAGSGTAHNILSATHTDSTAASVARGDLIVGQSATPTWQRLALGAAGHFLRSNATDALWSAILAADLPAAVVLDNEANTYTAGSVQDFSAARFLAPASTALPATCTPGKELFVDTDATPAGQQLYLCNSTGDGWNLVGDGGGGGSDLEVEVYEAGTQVGSIARRLDFANADDFVISQDTGNDQFDISLNRNVANGVAGLTASNKLPSAQGQEVWALVDLTDVAATTGSGSTAVLSVSPTLAGTPVIGDAAGNDKLAFAAEASNPACAGGDFFLWANSSEARFKKCQNGTLTDLDAGGTPAWEALFNASDNATAYISDATAETLSFDFQSNFSSGAQFLVRQQTGNPTGGILAEFLGQDPDLTVLRARTTQGPSGGDVWNLYAGRQKSDLSALSQFFISGNYPHSFNMTSPFTAADAGTLQSLFEQTAAGSHQYAALSGIGVATHTLGTLTSMMGVIAQVYVGGSGGTTTEASGIKTYVQVESGATVARTTGLRIVSNFNNGGTITDNIGLLVDSQTAGTNNWAIKTSGSARSQFGGAVDSDVGFRIANAATSGRCLVGNGTNFVESASNCVRTDTTDTLSNKTLDVEAAGNTVTTLSKITLVAAGCNNATAGPGFDLPTANAPAPACLGTSPHRFAALDFSDGSSQTAVTHFRLPADWTGNVDVVFLFTGDTASSNNIRWQVSSACAADAEDLLNPTYNTASASNVAGPATAGQRRSASFTSVSMANCAAGETAFWKFERVGGDAGDTYTGLARLLEVEITLRRTQ